MQTDHKTDGGRDARAALPIISMKEVEDAERVAYEIAGLARVMSRCALDSAELDQLDNKCANDLALCADICAREIDGIADVLDRVSSVKGWLSHE